uniref:Uncharacterized protein n=1 Tax=Anguilla anguilla TaxID=7936 RepID=A0A0E9WBM4_ANGAN
MNLSSYINICFVCLYRRLF